MRRIATTRRPGSPPRSPGPLQFVLAAALLSACADSSLSVSLVFPDQASITRAERVTILAVDPAGGKDCAAVLGKEATVLGAPVLTSVKLTVDDAEGLVFPRVPMQEMLISSLVFDANKLFLVGCVRVSVEPGDSVEVVVYLDCVAGETPCRDADGDGIGHDKDCDDADPCRSPSIKEASNLCSVAAATWTGAATLACRKKRSGAGETFTPPLCGDGVDNDCDGKDQACLADKDCDGFSPPQDCDDADAKINPAASELCNGKDDNCDKVTDEGCVPCDVDGDGHAFKGTTISGCNLPKDDPDDYDAGIHPGVTTAAGGGKEGGHALGALRQFCSSSLAKNGKAHRSVDHDADGLPAMSDGCPSATCDVDGDGFSGKQCSPPKSKLDCDDQNPMIFPGAPEKCGDGVAQNCVADASCTCDADGDGYCPASGNAAGDCDDTKKTIHPWATETCDRLDNDCDKLIDEGNPGATGALIATNVKKCNDDGDGQCAPAGKSLSGVCACSAVKPRSKTDASSRVACAGEDLKASASLRCFAAIQPRPERCDTRDWDCDGSGAPAKGQPFVKKGAVCGVDTGRCKAGTVAGCDLTQTVDSRITSVLKSAFSPHWICSPGTVLPAAEICNGFDDDCDGKIGAGVGTDLGWTELNEVDADGDGYLACTGCSAGTLKPGKKGCGDCKDVGAQKIHPGAYEACDNKDNNCVAGDDGKDQCKGSWSCCSSQGACRQLSSDVKNCSSCGKACPAATTNVCAAGKCVCGSTGAACSGNRNCFGGACACIPFGLCGGCCSGNSCQAGTATASCGDTGEACKTCTVTNPCKYPTCSGGNCGAGDRANGTACPGGMCHGGSCCTGCWGGSSCRAGNTTNNCGTGGASCSICSSSDPCKTAGCPSGTCVLSNRSDGTTCPGGMCRGGTCCTGCWSGSSCLAGISTSACGDNGASCTLCPWTPCKYSTCPTGTCGLQDQPSGTSCPGGACQGGVCIPAT